MKKLIYLFSVPAFLILISCGPENRTNDTMESEEINDSIEYNEEEFPVDAQMEDLTEPTEEIIPTDELPTEISKNVEKDEYLSTLELDRAVKIYNNDQTYYELIFKDDSNKIIAVIFDDRGNKTTI